MHSMCSASIQCAHIDSRVDRMFKTEIFISRDRGQGAEFKVHLKHLYGIANADFVGYACDDDGKQILIDIFGQCNANRVRQLFDNSWPTFSLLTRWQKVLHPNRFCLRQKHFDVVFWVLSSKMLRQIEIVKTK